MWTDVFVRQYDERKVIVLAYIRLAKIVGVVGYMKLRLVTVLGQQI